MTPKCHLYIHTFSKKRGSKKENEVKRPEGSSDSLKEDKNNASSIISSV